MGEPPEISGSVVVAGSLGGKTGSVVVAGSAGGVTGSIITGSTKGVELASSSAKTIIDGLIIKAKTKRKTRSLLFINKNRADNMPNYWQNNAVGAKIKA
jgi:hypothetical protein